MVKNAKNKTTSKVKVKARLWVSESRWWPGQSTQAAVKVRPAPHSALPTESGRVCGQKPFGHKPESILLFGYCSSIFCLWHLYFMFKFVLFWNLLASGLKNFVLRTEPSVGKFHTVVCWWSSLPVFYACAAGPQNSQIKQGS